MNQRNNLLFGQLPLETVLFDSAYQDRGIMKRNMFSATGILYSQSYASQLNPKLEPTNSITTKSQINSTAYTHFISSNINN